MLNFIILHLDIKILLTYKSLWFYNMQMEFSVPWYFLPKPTSNPQYYQTKWNKWNDGFGAK